MKNTTQQRFQQTQRNRTSDFKQYLGFDKKFGYLHELREIQTTQSKTYTARIAVPVGQGDHMNYVNFELYIKSADALIVFLSNQEAISDEDTKVTVRFSCGNAHPRAYVAQSGQREGQAIPYVGGNLTYLHTMKIDGVVIHGYKEENNDDQQTGETVDKETGEVIGDAREGSLDIKGGGDVIALPSEYASSDANLPESPPVEAYESELESVSDPDDKTIAKHSKKRTTRRTGRSQSTRSLTA